jgi:hypothetical protein
MFFNIAPDPDEVGIFQEPKSKESRHLKRSLLGSGNLAVFLDAILSSWQDYGSSTAKEGSNENLWTF